MPGGIPSGSRGNRIDEPKAGHVFEILGVPRDEGQSMNERGGRNDCIGQTHPALLSQRNRTGDDGFCQWQLRHRFHSAVRALDSAGVILGNPRVSIRDTTLIVALGSASQGYSFGPSAPVA